MGLNINSNFDWTNHIDQISIALKKRIRLLRRMRNRIPRDKLIIIAEAIFVSKIRYGIPVYLNPVYEREDLKRQNLPTSIKDLQSIQNSMIRTILGLKIQNQINMVKLRKEIKMMSINQLIIYHIFMEGYNLK